MTLKRYVWNRARPEGCIAMRYIADECVQFCSGFIKETVDVYQRQERNDEDVASNSILEGRPISAGVSYEFNDDFLYESAHRYILFNSTVVEPYLE